MISVIVPVYNGEAYIKRCLDSIFSDADSELEVIVVNDGSKDATSELLHAYAASQPMMKVIDKENEGAGRARLTGLGAAAGDYVTFVDADDWVEPAVYAKAAQTADETDADIVVFDYVTEYPTSSERVQSRFAEDQTFPMTGEEAIRLMNCRQAVFSFLWNKLYRRSLLSDITFPPRNFIGEDYAILIHLFEKTKRVSYLPAVGYHYAMTENSVSRGGYGPSIDFSYEQYRALYERCLSRHPERKTETTHYLMVEYMSFIIAMGRNRTYNKDMIRQIKGFVRKGFWSFLGASYVPVTMKGSAVALTVSYRLLIVAYRLLRH